MTRGMKNRRVTRGLAVPSTFFAVVGALVLLLSSCSGGPTDEAAADLAERCGTKDPGVPVQALDYDPDSGESVDGYVLGEGANGVVFSNQTDTDLCDWLPLATQIAGSDRKALVYDYSYKPDAAKEVEAAAGSLTDLAVEKVVLVGASKGAVGSIMAAPSIQEPTVSGVASLSVVGEFEGLDPREDAGELEMPLLLMAARDDGDTAEVAQKIGEVAMSEDQRVEVFDGYDHGVDLLGGGESPEARGILLHFIDRNLPRD